MAHAPTALLQYAMAWLAKIVVETNQTVLATNIVEKLAEKFTRRNTSTHEATKTRRIRKGNRETAHTGISTSVALSHLFF
ncbi:MAG: hypothetical protein A2563_01940 [Candidatus Magasanikbacteria bacterium RIFOXYD1_FULL_40_23]|uniref:Uncharacterized protein n=1 Tax=Candidatus Magasanikbacteria bacterium RIFOXYD1_FULL_40_23 TaxID=1798705 RepID=A0A1F6PB12_9BACT|nr:MAG: hypothetical protein A2563_01940 [Candidatus Magasanikbacteria bacterium RIFOXYD1_FULL_40_23]